ncbi:MAG: NAD(P)/FAD-dependent oxidoreductase [Flavobacterium sp.]|nr:NAD(P)/FAD-dependent oxidoreductase [Flavobacterium sp.]
MNIPESDFSRLVIIGAGFAGIALAKKLRRKKFQVVLLDKHNYHNFQPLLYQVATGGLEVGSIAHPIRKIIHNYPNFYFRMAQVKEIDPDKQIIRADIGELSYDYLVVATGSKTNYFGNREMERTTMSMKTVSQALNIRTLILENFEQAVLSKDPVERNCLMTFCIVGGGPTGVELAGALAEMKKDIFQKDYPDLDISLMTINLIQSGDAILNTMSAKSSAAAEKFLRELGVNIYKNHRVVAYDGRVVITNTDTKFNSSTVIWTAGVQGAMIRGLTNSVIDARADRLKVDAYNRVNGYENVFAIGDIAFMQDENNPQGLPMMAQPAIQQGEHLAENLDRLLKNRVMEAFEYENKGSMATIGRNKAVVDLPHLHLNGILAWFMWIFVHLFAIIGFKNRLMVFMTWAYNYVRRDREDRLIIRPYKKKSFTAFTSDEV